MGVQLRARGDPADPACAARPALPEVVATARSAAAALAAIEAPLLALTRSLEDLLDQGAETLTGAERGRIEGVLRGLDRRARMTLPAWRGMLATLDGEPEPVGGDVSASSDFVDWFEATVIGGRAVDAAFRRHWVDPTEPLARTVLEPAHGVLVTSATLTDAAAEDPFDLAELRSGGGRLETPPRRLRLASPFNYETCARAFVVTDVRKDDARQVAAAMRELFLAAGGGGLGLFTAIRRLRAVHELIAAPLGDRGLSLYAQHVDPLEVGALVDAAEVALRERRVTGPDREARVDGGAEVPEPAAHAGPRAAASTLSSTAIGVGRAEMASVVRVAPMLAKTSL
jgi:ATP-dependent DNA helicase DinG